MARGRRVLLLAALTLLVGGGSAGGATREYSTGPLDYPIPDVGTLEVPLRVLQHGPVSFLAVELQIDHPRDSDLTLSLVAPTGATVVLSAKRGGDAGDFGTGRACGFELPMFRDDGFTPIASAKPPFQFDTYIPEQPLRTLYGIDAAGVWKLRRRGLMILLVAAALAPCLGAIGLVDTPWAIGAIMFVIGVLAGLMNVHISAWVMQRIAPEVRGRVSSVLMLAYFGILPISFAVAGFLVAWSLKFMFIFAGLAMLLAAAGASIPKSVREIE